jgi:hypothetical protein
VTAFADTLPASSRNEVLAPLFRDEPVFTALGLFIAALVAPTLFAAVVEQRQLAGVNVWAKPLKFEFSLVAYLITLAFFARFLPAGTTRRRWYRIYSAIVAGAIVAELIWLIGAAGAGVASHFNRATPLMDAAYAVMGVGAVTLTTPTLVYGVMIARNQRSGLSPALKGAVSLGLVLTFVLTLLVAGTMASGTTHLVGGNLSDAEAAPLMGWARDGGDLRVPHFFATHAMHFIPAFGLLSVVMFGRTDRRPVWAFAALFAAFVGWTFLQALSGRPFLPMI